MKLSSIDTLDAVIRQEKLPLRDAIAILLAVSMASLPNLVPPMLYGPIESRSKILLIFYSTADSSVLLWGHTNLLLLSIRTLYLNFTQVIFVVMYKF